MANRFDGICPRCGTRERSKFGYCKPCYTDYRREWRKNHPDSRDRERRYAKRYRKENPERFRQIKKRAYRKFRDKVIAKLGGKCVNCGTTERLEVNHIDGGGTKEFRARGPEVIYREILDGVRPDIDCRCKPCNDLYTKELQKR